MRAWWFGPKTLPYDDGRRVKVGRTHKVKGEIVLCFNGLHGSVLPLDALSYGSGHFWRVEHSGTIAYGYDKLCSSERTYLRFVPNTDEVLHKFARLCALDVVHRWDAPDVVVRYLRTGDESIRHAALDAAREAAGGAARDAAWDAARDAAGAAWDAARDAALDAARDAASDAAWATAKDVARDTWGDAWEDAYEAARNAQNKRLHRMLMEASR